MMYLYLPVALTSINIFIPIGLGLAVGLLSGLFGVGGGFLMTPLLIMLGIPATVAAATDSNQIVAASTSGTYAHWRVGYVDFKMGLYRDDMKEPMTIFIDEYRKRPLTKEELP